MNSFLIIIFITLTILANYYASGYAIPTMKSDGNCNSLCAGHYDVCTMLIRKSHEQLICIRNSFICKIKCKSNRNKASKTVINELKKLWQR